MCACSQLLTEGCLLGMYDKQLEEVHTAPEQVELPAVNAVVVVVVTAVVSAARFYVQMPLGSKSALKKSTVEQGWDIIAVTSVFNCIIFNRF